MLSSHGGNGNGNSGSSEENISNFNLIPNETSPVKELPKNF